MLLWYTPAKNNADIRLSLLEQLKSSPYFSSGWEISILARTLC